MLHFLIYIIIVFVFVIKQDKQTNSFLKPNSTIISVIIFFSIINNTKKNAPTIYVFQTKQNKNSTENPYSNPKKCPENHSDTRKLSYLIQLKAKLIVFFKRNNSQVHGSMKSRLPCNTKHIIQLAKWVDIVFFLYRNIWTNFIKENFFLKIYFNRNHMSTTKSHHHNNTTT